MLNETVIAGLNNPECALYVGMVACQLMIVKWLFALFIAIMIFQAVDSLAWKPFVDWLHKIIYKRMKNNEPTIPKRIGRNSKEEINNDNRKK